MRDPFYDDTFLAEDASAGDRAFADFLGSRNAALASMPGGGIARYTPPPAEDLPPLGEMFIQPTPSPVQAPPQMASVSAPEEFQGLPPPPPPPAEPSPPLPDFGPGNPLYNPAMAGLSDFFANARPETFRGPDGGLDPRFLVPNYRTAADIPAEPAAPFPTSYEPAPPLAPAPPPPGLTGGDFQSWEPPAPFIPPAEPGPPPAAPFIPPAAPAPPVFDAPPRVIREREREREDLWMPPDPRTVAGDRPGLGYRPTPPPDLPPLGTLLPEPEPAAPPPSPPPAPPAQPAPVELPPEPAPYSPPIREREPTPPVPVPVPQPKIPPPAPPPTDLPPVAPPPPMTTMPIPGFTPEPAPPPPPPPPPGLISSPVPQLPPAQPPVAPPPAQPPQGFDFGSLPSWMFDEGTDLGRLLRRIRGRGSRTTLATSGTGGSSMPGAAPGQPGGGIAIPTAGAVPTPQGYGGSGQIPIGGNVSPVPMPGMFGSIGSGGTPAMGGGGLGSLPPPPGLTPGLAQGSVPGLAQNPNLSPGVLGGAGMMGYYRDRMGNIIASPGAGLFGGSVPGFAEGGTVSKEDIRRRAMEYQTSDPGMQPPADPEFSAGFLRGAASNLSGRARDALQLLLELRSPLSDKPRTRELVRGAADLGASFVRDPEGTLKGMGTAEVDRLEDAAAGPEAAGEYAASFLPMGPNIRGIKGIGGKVTPPPARSTIRKAERKSFPGIYENPRRIAREAESRVPPESPNLGRLFGVSRADLARMSEQPGTAKADIPGLPPTPRGSERTEKVMMPANERRLRESLDVARDYAPRLFEGMRGWYMMDPAYQRLVDLVGPDEAAKRYERFNTLTAMASPGSPVTTELRRGSAANMLANLGRFNEFRDFGGLKLSKRQRRGLPEELLQFPSHAYHKTSQARPMEDYLRSGRVQMSSAKVPPYMQASNASALGRQSDMPVPDAHFARGVGLSDARAWLSEIDKDTGERVQLVPGQSMSVNELAVLGPWYREQVARQAGLEAVPGQAVQWGFYSKPTGVDTAVGVPKLELLADLIERTARRRGISLEKARDLVLLGEEQLGFADGGEVSVGDRIKRAILRPKQIYDEALAAGKEYGAEEEVHGKGDALRHLIAQARLQREYGDTAASMISRLKELEFRNEIFDPIFGSNPGITPGSRMDRENNALGMEIAKKAASDEDVPRIAREYVTSGKARVIPAVDRARADTPENVLNPRTGELKRR